MNVSFTFYSGVEAFASAIWYVFPSSSLPTSVPVSINSISKIRTPHFGSAFDSHTGIEAGMVIIDRTVNATKLDNPLPLTQPSILRRAHIVYRG